MSHPRGLGWDREDNPALYDLYAKKLLRPGWAGRMSTSEKAYLRPKNPPWYQQRQTAGLHARFHPSPTAESASRPPSPRRPDRLHPKTHTRGQPSEKVTRFQIQKQKSKP